VNVFALAASVLAALLLGLSFPGARMLAAAALWAEIERQKASSAESPGNPGHFQAAGKAAS